eukprot:CAMPEP_0114120174 /NCGR_PEP_ID=MMETSP0043_2-20121206/6505_1 /TAXON_ID=464988 /ORGANISM="Hemiselmis andersenii, Strain CCMP644" /LENGTH=71 /DNA_ID=CAMNT_0001212773 /DNA_START=131 /DNA_END=346 /DNA_ORIENTATION=-
MAGFWLEPIKFSILVLMPIVTVVAFQHPPTLNWAIDKTRYVVYPEETGRAKLEQLHLIVREAAQARAAEKK